MKTTLHILFLFVISIAFSQNQNEEKFLFEHKLIVETNKDSIAKHLKIIKEISVTSTIDSIQANSNWKLLYLHETGWAESVPNQRNIINSLYIGKPNNGVTDQDLKDFFKRIGRTEILLDQFPFEVSVEPRGAPLNGKWTIIFLKNNHITLQYIHSYPNGNQSSWFRKTNYYLKKIN
jgi:hypothetical protein